MKSAADGVAPMGQLVEKLVARRHELGYSQESLAAIAGISRRTLAALETGGNCTLVTLGQVAQALEVRLELSADAVPHRRPTLDDMFELNRRERFGSHRDQEPA
jgi:DNA-binding XRE family transcriptional regulator